MAFKLIKKLDNGVRVGELATPHGVIHTPFFMPVATVGSVKSMAPWELEELGAEIVLSNTYHLYLRPGEQLIKELGGLHKFMGWDKPILTDSGGYQVFSLSASKSQISSLKSQNEGKGSIKNSSQRLRGEGKSEGRDLGRSLVRITEEGVEFKSHLDGSKHFFTPEKVIQIQLDLGVDILMPLDVCPSGKASREEVKRATEITIRWAERAKRYFDQQIQSKYGQRTNRQQTTGKISLAPSGRGEGEGNNSTIQQFNNFNKGFRPLLHGIVQGGMDLGLREYCAKKLMDLDFDGYSVGGLAVDLETRDMWDVVELMGKILPENKQRYLMGVGTPNDIIMATRRGMDMFDCVLPTRMARHGSVYVKSQISNLKTKEEDLFEYTTPTPLLSKEGASLGTLSKEEGGECRYNLPF